MLGFKPCINCGLTGATEAARVHHASRWCGGGVADYGTCAAVDDAGRASTFYHPRTFLTLCLHSIAVSRKPASSKAKTSQSNTAGRMASMTECLS